VVDIQDCHATLASPAGKSATQPAPTDHHWLYCARHRDDDCEQRPPGAVGPSDPVLAIRSATGRIPKPPWAHWSGTPQLPGYSRNVSSWDGCKLRSGDHGSVELAGSNPAVPGGSPRLRADQPHIAVESRLESRDCSYIASHQLRNNSQPPQHQRYHENASPPTTAVRTVSPWRTQGAAQRETSHQAGHKFLQVHPFVRQAKRHSARSCPRTPTRSSTGPSGAAPCQSSSLCLTTRIAAS
jgi:hypothetical protein